MASARDRSDTSIKTRLDEYRNSKEYEEVQSIIIERVTRSLVAEGLIKTRGLSKAEIRIKAAEYIIQHKPEIAPVIDHSDSLLEQAEAHVRAKNPDLAILFYATWTEHLINFLISIYGRRRKLEFEDIAQIIRETNFRAKTTWLLQLLKAPLIPESLLKVLGLLMESRNSFVHYKWKSGDPNIQRVAQWKLIADFRRTKKFLQKYGLKHVFRGYRYQPK